MNLGSQRIIKMDCVVREPLHCLAAQPRETAIFEGEPGGALRISSNQPSLPAKRGFVVQLHADAHVEQGQGKGRVRALGLQRIRALRVPGRTHGVHSPGAHPPIEESPQEL